MSKQGAAGSNSGFSLIEVLFAVALLSVVAFGVLKLETGQMKLGQTQKKALEAYSLSHQGIEAAKALGRAALSAACLEEACTCRLAAEGQGLECGQGAETVGELQRSMILESQGLAGAWKATSQVDWEDGSGAHSVQIKRIISL